MPQIFRIGSYWVYFGADEQKHLEPIRVHIAEGKPIANATKVWITKSRRCLLCNNNSKIPTHILKNIMRIIETQSNYIIEKWYNFFGEITYYC